MGLRDYHLWSDTIKKKDLVARIQNDLQKKFPGAFFSTGQPIIDQVMEIVTGSAADLAISVIGEVALASSEQLRAILSILIVAIVGLIPAAISSGIGSDVQRPLATVIIGGLTSTLIFAPFVLPPLYFLLERNSLRT